MDNINIKKRSSHFLTAYHFFLLFNDAVRKSRYVAPTGRMITKLEGIWERAAVVQFETLSPHLAEGSKKNHAISVVIVGYRQSFDSGPSRLICSR
jgi:hypothetical protein